MKHNLGLGATLGDLRKILSDIKAYPDNAKLIIRSPNGDGGSTIECCELVKDVHQRFHTSTVDLFVLSPTVIKKTSKE